MKRTKPLPINAGFREPHILLDKRHNIQPRFNFLNYGIGHVAIIIDLLIQIFNAASYLSLRQFLSVFLEPNLEFPHANFFGCDR